jgi:hypothetical protein
MDQVSEIKRLLRESTRPEWADRLEGCETENICLMCSCQFLHVKKGCHLKRLCVVCAEKAAKKARRTYGPMFEGLPLFKERKGRGLSFLTLTLENCQSIAIGMFKIKKAIKRFYHTQFGKHIKGGIVCYEVTKNEETGLYHVHAHLIIESRWLENREKSVFNKVLDRNVSPLCDAWFWASEGSYIVYIEAVKSREKALDYCMKYSFKMPSLNPGELINFAIQMYRKRSFYRFGSLYKIKLVKVRAVCSECNCPFEYLSEGEYLYIIKVDCLSVKRDRGRGAIYGC